MNMDPKPCLAHGTPIPEHKGVLLLVLDDDEGELLLLEVQLSNLGPEEEADFGLPLEYQDTRGGEPQAAEM